jgi:hypothetical protein
MQSERLGRPGRARGVIATLQPAGTTRRERLSEFPRRAGMGRLLLRPLGDVYRSAALLVAVTRSLAPRYYPGDLAPKRGLVPIPAQAAPRPFSAKSGSRDFGRTTAKAVTACPSVKTGPRRGASPRGKRQLMVEENPCGTALPKVS